MSGIQQILLAANGGASGDPYFGYTTLLLPGNGTNGAQNNTFLDSSANAFSITRNGNVTQGTFSPFGSAAPWSALANGGSGYFDGAGDYLTIADNAALQMGTGDFTLELWWYPTTIAGFQNVFDKGYTAAGTLMLRLGTSSGDGLLTLRAGGSAVVITSSTVLPINQWVHIAVARSGTSVRMWFNGTSVGSNTNSSNLNNASALAIGGTTGGASELSGYLSNIRLVKGTAVYNPASSTITVPTAPLTAISGTSLLCSFTNAGIYDATSKNDLETVGNAQISTTQSKFGGSSMYFDGVGDWLAFPNTTNTQLGTGDFTIEGWVYLSATGVAYGLVSKGTGTTGWSVNITSGNKLQFSYTSSTLAGATSLVSGTWYHFAVTRFGSSSGNVKVFLNGTVDATSASAVVDDFSQTSIAYVGASRTGTTALNGYLNDVRITKGIARYTSSFTQPTAAFPVF